MDMPRLTPLAESLPASVPFVGPEAIERTAGRAFRARLGANESGFGPAPSVIQAIGAAAPHVWKYCDPENHDLKAAIARHCGVAPENVAVGEGIDGLLGLVVRLYVEPGAPVVTSLGAYPTFNYHVAGFGGRLVTVPYADDREDPAALLDAVRREASPLVYFANPDNPMGTWADARRVNEFIEALPATTMLVLDEAYGEFAPEGTMPPLDLARPNVLRMRTFSKAYGLAGMRCGYALGEAGVIRSFDKVRNHFGVNLLAQVAAAAALADRPYLEEVIGRVERARRIIAGIGEANGLKPLPSATNFVTIDCRRDGEFAGAILRSLAERGVFIRKPMAPGLDRCIRVSVGPDDELALFGETLEETMKAVRL